MAAVHPLPAAPTPSRHARNWREASRREPCPYCDHTDWCRVFADGAWECMRTPGDHPCRSGGWMYWPGGRRPENWQDRIAALPSRPPRPTVDVALLDRVYRVVMEHAPLSDEDRANLHGRGLTDAEIADNFGTLPDDPRERARIVAAVTEALGQDPAGVVPGFVRKRGRTELVNLPGLIVAGWTEDGLLSSIQVRVRNPGEGGKYRHLSAGDGPGSIGADGHFVNVSRPARPVSTRVVLLTEGYIKGLILAHRLGRTALSVAGVSNTGKVVATLKALGDVEEVWLAYDRDSATNPHVAAAEVRVVREIAAAGYTVKQLDWPAEYGKGLDDALRAGVIPVAIAHPALAETRTDDETPSASVGRRLEQLQAERDSARIVAQSRLRIQRNTRLPARPMAQVAVGVFANAATLRAPAGDYQGRVPPGFVVAPVRGLSTDAGTKNGNGGKQLKDLEAAGLIRRKVVKEILPAGQADPETGEVAKNPRVYSKHFIAIAGHEHEPITPDLVRGLIDRMATYDPGTKEQRGGERIPRCKKHPHAEVHRHSSYRCGECGDELHTDITPVPAMLLEPLAPDNQSLLARGNATDDEAPSTDDQTLIVRDSPSAPTTKQTPLVKDSGGIRPIAYEVRQRAAAAVDQSLVVRRQRAYADLTVLHEREPNGHEPDDQSFLEDDAGAPEPPPPLTLFPLAGTGCVGCGAVVAEGQIYCRNCDPRTA